MSRTTGLRRWRKWWNRERLHLRGGGRSAGSGRRQRWSSATREVRERADARAALAYRAPDTHVAYRFHETAETSLSGIPPRSGAGYRGKRKRAPVLTTQRRRCRLRKRRYPPVQRPMTALPIDTNVSFISRP